MQFLLAFLLVFTLCAPVLALVWLMLQDRGD